MQRYSGSCECRRQFQGCCLHTWECNSLYNKTVYWPRI